MKSGKKEVGGKCCRFSACFPHWGSELRVLGGKAAGCCGAELVPVSIKGGGMRVRLGEKQRQKK